MADYEPLRDYRRSRAVLIGTSQYTRLPPVPAAVGSLDRMVSMLTSGLCGWPSDRISVFHNEAGPGDLPDQLITLFEEARDVALFYFVGHGQIDLDDQLCLALSRSRDEAHRRSATSLQFHSVRRAMLGSPAKTKIVILDCCFAGLASRPSSTLGTPDDLADMAAGTGAYTMGASSAYATAWFERRSRKGGQPQTYFTKYLADLVESGIPGESAGLRLRTLFDRLQHNLALDGHPLPVHRNIDTASDFIFARNAVALTVGSRVDPQRVGRKNEQLHDVLADIARRSQHLLHRQLQMLDSLERTATDPDDLAQLFQIDHLTTRMNRHSESLRVLAGIEPSRGSSQSVALADVLRAATAEVEHYARVTIRMHPGPAVIGPAVAGTIHMLAELIENATLFSPPDTAVEVSTHELANGGSLVDISDRGPGMSEQSIAAANWRLENPDSADVSVSSMGLFVVARLASWHGIKVRLRSPQHGGLVALVWLPDRILTREPESVNGSLTRPDMDDET